MIQVAKIEEGITTLQSKLDQDKYLLGTAVSLKMGSFNCNSKESMITKRA
jgi:hypothetical protein